MTFLNVAPESLRLSASAQERFAAGKAQDRWQKRIEQAHAEGVAGMAARSTNKGANTMCLPPVVYGEPDS